MNPHVKKNIYQVNGMLMSLARVCVADDQPFAHFRLNHFSLFTFISFIFMKIFWFSWTEIKPIKRESF